MSEKTIEQRKQEALARQSILASPSVTAPRSQQVSLQQSQNIATAIRVGQGDERLSLGQPRVVATDLANLQQTQKIAKVETASPDVASTFSTQDEQVQAVIETGAKSSDQADIERATWRVQRYCNHRFSSVTQSCTICGKNRSDHV